MGGAIAQTIALEQPAFLAGLVLIGTGAVMKVSPQILEHICSDLPAVADFITKYAWSKSANFIMKGVGRKRVLENEPAVLYGDYAACNGFDIRQRLGQINVPTLIIAGEKDMFMPLKFSTSLAKGIAQSQLVVIPTAGHKIQLEKPDLVREAIVNFINSIERP
jgi:pimeloyl-ACP methyl ester carboxylesterase